MSPAAEIPVEETKGKRGKGSRKKGEEGEDEDEEGGGAAARQGGGDSGGSSEVELPLPISSPSFSFSPPSGPPIIPAALAAYKDSRAPSENRLDEKKEEDVAAEAEAELGGLAVAVSCRGGERGGGYG